MVFIFVLEMPALILGWCYLAQFLLAFWLKELWVTFVNSRVTINDEWIRMWKVVFLCILRGEKKNTHNKQTNKQTTLCFWVYMQSTSLDHKAATVFNFGIVLFLKRPVSYTFLALVPSDAARVLFWELHNLLSSIKWEVSVITRFILPPAILRTVLYIVVLETRMHPLFQHLLFLLHVYWLSHLWNAITRQL